jgi:integrase/recombinase XerD
MTFDEALAMYLTDMKMLNLAPRSIVTKRYNLKQFNAWLLQVGVTDMKAVTQAHMEEYRKYLFEKTCARGKAYAVRSRNGLLASCKTMFKFLLKHGHLPTDPAAPIDYAIQIQKMPSVLSLAEVKKIIHAPDVTSYIGLRDRALMELLWSSSLRESELCALDLEDIDMNTQLIRVRSGKGRKDRMAVFGGYARRWLTRYIELSRPILAAKNSTETALFVTYQSGRMSADVVFYTVKKLAKKARVQRNVYPHIFRATAATEMLRRGANLRFIQVYLGHSRLDTVQAYTRLNPQDMRRDFSKYHPRAVEFRADNRSIGHSAMQNWKEIDVQKLLDMEGVSD